MVTYLLVALICTPMNDCRWRRIGVFHSYQACEKAGLRDGPPLFKCVMQGS